MFLNFRILNFALFLNFLSEKYFSIEISAKKLMRLYISSIKTHLYLLFFLVLNFKTKSALTYFFHN